MDASDPQKADLPAEFNECTVQRVRAHKNRVIKDVEFESDYIMKEEVFGPILSMVPMKGSFADWKSTAIRLISSSDTPLALYVFSRNKKVMEELSLKINAGTVCVNDTITFMALRNLPFGGSGASGMGRYAGKYIGFSN